MKHFTGFQAGQFELQVQKALKNVAKILATSRAPKLASDVQEHSYDDKYALVDFLTNTSIAALWNTLERMGLDQEDIVKLQHVLQEDKRSLTLRFQAEDTCSFHKEVNVDVVNNVEYELVAKKETMKSGGLCGPLHEEEESSLNHIVTTKVKEFHWEVGVSFKLFIFAGNDPKKIVVELSSRSSSTVVVATGDEKRALFPHKTTHKPVDVNVTWLISQIARSSGDDKKEQGAQECVFKTDRSSETCKTPVRNEDITKALEFMNDISNWSRLCSRHFCHRVEKEILGRHNPAIPGPTLTGLLSLQDVTAERVFCPIFPLLQVPSHEAPETATRQDSHHHHRHRQEHPKSLLVITSPTSNEQSPLLSLGDINKFLNEQIRSLESARDEFNDSFPLRRDPNVLISCQEATLQLMWLHIRELVFCFKNSVYYIEEMFRKQLIAAIGKEVQPDDFDQYMAFHFRKLYGPQFAPKPFCFAIRQPSHSPEGILSIESTDTSEGIEPIETIVRVIPGEASPLVKIPLNAATTIEITGDRYLHGWMQHRFEFSGVRPSFNLVARARQFSSFVLMIGVMAGPDKFNPKAAIILQNKDEVLIPLLLNELPTAKEFKDSVASLSPEQRRFATAFRGMQLEASVFGVCVIQLKPQLEVLLNLPKGALTKEVKLTEDLTTLFVDYQIPSDLLSFEGVATASLRDKLAEVKEHVKAVMDVIAHTQKSQLKEAQLKAEMNVQKLFAEAQMMENAKYDDDAIMEFEEMGMENAAVEVTAATPGAPPPMPRVISVTKKTVKGATATSGGRAKRRSGSREFTALPKTTAATTPRHSNKTYDSAAQATQEALQFSSVATGDIGLPLSLDYTMIPKRLDAKFEKYDTDSSLHAAIIQSQQTWSRKRQENLLTPIVEEPLIPDDIKLEKNKAFDLLDALSRSGNLPISCAELHVIVAVTHCFENDVMGTVIQDNINPIEKVERSSLMIASTLHDCSVTTLIEDDTDTERLAGRFPALFHGPEEILFSTSMETIGTENQSLE